MRALTVVLTLVLAHPFAARANPVPPPLPFHLTVHGGIVVSVRLDHRDSVPFLVDTGSNGSVITEPLAASLGLVPSARTTMASAIGRTLRPVVRIEHLHLGGVHASGVMASVVPLTDFHLPDAAADGRAVQGIIGQDVLGALRYTIDYRARRIVWHEDSSEPRPRGMVLALEPRDDRFLVVLPQRRSTIRLVPDSGTETLVFFRRDARAEPPMRLEEGTAGVSGVAGAATARTARVDALQIGSTTLNDLPAVVVDRDVSAVGGDGLLPLHLFARVTFNGPERELVIQVR